jgi:hypothetical protein
MPISQDEIRSYLSSIGDVFIQIANPVDGSPEMAWGDTFVYCRKEDGTIAKMPFVTIITKDYEGFDSESQLNLGNSFRLNFEMGQRRFEETFGFEPAKCDENRKKFDFSAKDKFFPHPVYGKSAWACIVDPTDGSRDAVESHLNFAFQLAHKRIAV